MKHNFVYINGHFSNSYIVLMIWRKGGEFLHLTFYTQCNYPPQNV